MQTLIAGQPIKFRYSGQTEGGARGNKGIFELITASEALSGLLRDNPDEFLRTYKGLSRGANDFLRATIGNWSQNSNEGEFDRWYKSASHEVKTFLRKLGLKIRPLDQMRGQNYVVGTYAFSGLPKDLPLPEEVKRKIDKNSRRIDADKGAKDFTYAVYAPQGVCQVVETFKLNGNISTWAKFGSVVVSDPNYAYEVIPITIKDLLGGLQAEIETYESAITKGGLDGAVEARKQFLLQKVYEKLQGKSSPEELLQVVQADNRFPAPETGVYVLLPKDAGVRKREKPFAVRANPRYDEDKIAGIIGVLTAEDRGFENLRLQALEVPERALSYISNPRTLEVRLSPEFER